METRTFQIENIRAESMTADATLSTEYPVRRYDGEEVLSHDQGAVDLSRAPLPLIVSHDGGKLPVGVVENLRLEGKTLKGVLRFSKNASDIWQDVTDGILRNLSIGYQIIQRTKTKVGYIATKWMPYETSLVAAGADPAAGIGRNFNIGGNTMDRNDLLKERKQVIDSMVEMASRDLSAEDKEKFDRIKEGLDGIDRRLAALDDIEKVKKPEFRKVPDVGKQTREIRFEGGPATDRSFKGMFGEPVYNEDEIRAFRASMTEGIPSGGGMSVPEPLSAKWLDDSLPEEIIRPNAQVWPMESATRKVPGWDWTDMSSGEAFGGFKMVWTAETGTATPQTALLRAITLNAYKGQIYCDVSQELFDDGLGFDAQLERAMKKSIAYGLESAFTTGTGAGMPKGLTVDEALVSVAKETGQIKDSLCFDNVAKMFGRMYPAGRSKAVWLVSETCLPMLMTGMNVAIGTAGSWVNLFNEKDGKFTILGRPVLFSGGHMPVLGDANDIMFVDLSQYAIGLRKEMRIERSPIPQWTTDQMSYRVIVRADGMGTWSAAYSPDNGDDQSWIVGLAERA